MHIELPSGRCIGDQCYPFIIAEVGSNWRDLDDCLKSIAMAKAAGADAVKFQAFDFKSLYGIPNPDLTAGVFFSYDDPQIIDHPYALRLKWLPHLKEKADSCGIEFMCTAFSPELYDAVDPYVNIHKVASAEMSHVRILEKVKSLGKPVILSTGAHGKSDISAALEILGDTKTILMYCVASYPAKDIDFRHLFELKKFEKLVGYSDHTTDYACIPKDAVDSGACVIEKHFTAIDADTPDRPHSLTVDEFKKMVQIIRGERPFVWGSGEENEMRLRHNRRLISTKLIKTGERFSEGENFGIYRSLNVDTRGLSPFVVEKVNGRVATRYIQPGEAIGPGDFE